MSYYYLLVDPDKKILEDGIIAAGDKKYNIFHAVQDLVDDSDPIMLKAKLFRLRGGYYDVQVTDLGLARDFYEEEMNRRNKP